MKNFRDMFLMKQIFRFLCISANFVHRPRLRSEALQSNNLFHHFVTLGHKVKISENALQACFEVAKNFR